jgi:hypothetical protein
MKRNVVIAITAGLFLVLIGLVVISSRGPEHHPPGLSYWLRAAAARDWSLEATHGEPRAQLCCGINLIRSNLIVMTDRTELLADIPVIGKRYFEKTSYDIDSTISQEQLAEAYRWVRKAVDQGFAPAKEAEKLFAGKVPMPNPGGAANRSQPVTLGTNAKSAAAGSGR